MTDPRLEHDIQTGEGCRLIAYKDALGFWTIGWGHLMDQSKDHTGEKITLVQANSYLDADITSATEKANSLPEWVWLDTDCRRNAVIELCFNLGNKWLDFHKARSAMQNHQWQVAHDELLNSTWAKQVGPDRSTRLANYLLTGQYPT